jgi:hypothetical protein
MNWLGWVFQGFLIAYVVATLTAPLWLPMVRRRAH